jgi:hypothetical protein
VQYWDNSLSLADDSYALACECEFATRLVKDGLSEHVGLDMFRREREYPLGIFTAVGTLDRECERRAGRSILSIELSVCRIGCIM